MPIPTKGNTDRICIGVITGAHGMAGAVKVKSFTADPADLTSYGAVTDETGKRQFHLSLVKQNAKALVIKVDGIADRTAAEQLKGTEVYIPRDALPQLEEDEFYNSDLAGLQVELEDGKKFGVVRMVDNFGAGDVMEIEMTNGKTAFYSFTKAVVPVVDLENRRMVLNPPNEVSERDHDGNGTEEQ